MQTLSDILDEIEQARQFAIEQQKPTAMLQASMAKAKLLGLDKGDTLTIKHNEPPVFNIQPVRTLTELDKQEFEQIAKRFWQWFNFSLGGHRQQLKKSHILMILLFCNEKPLQPF